VRRYTSRRSPAKVVRKLSTVVPMGVGARICLEDQPNAAMHQAVCGGIGHEALIGTIAGYEELSFGENHHSWLWLFEI